MSSTAGPKKYEEARLLYLQTSKSLKEVAEELDHDYAALRKAASRGDWSHQKARMSQRVEMKALDDMVKTRASELAQWNLDDLNSAKVIRNLALEQVKLLRTSEEGLSVSDLQGIARTLETAQRMGRLALNVSTDNHAIAGFSQSEVKLELLPSKELGKAIAEALEKY